MEDDSATLDFNPDTYKFTICQNNKHPYTLQNLSSGYSAIFAIYSNLLMRAEYLHIIPSKLQGLAIIDEIDAHLHVSLQRKILPFLQTNFPGIQFISSTHSPFVITSVNNAVIYDLSTNEQIDELSSYSYEAIVEGLFDTPASSEILRQKVYRLAVLLNKRLTSTPEFTELLADLYSNIEHLDEESKFYVNKAKLSVEIQGDR